MPKRSLAEELAELATSGPAPGATADTRLPTGSRAPLTQRYAAFGSGVMLTSFQLLKACFARLCLTEADRPV